MEPGSSAGQENGNKKNKKDKGPLKPGDKRKPEASKYEVTDTLILMLGWDSYRNALVKFCRIYTSDRNGNFII